MPLIKDLKTNEGSQILIWKDEESLEFFINNTTLSKKEKELLNTYTNERRKKDLVIARHLIQRIIPMAEVSYLESGKPYLKKREAQISISHTKDLVAIMINKTALVGLDIEYISPRVDKLSSRFLSTAESKYANNTSLRTLYWSAKETLFKLDKEQGLDFRTHLNLEPKSKDLLEGRIKNGDPIKINYSINSEWVLTHASISVKQ